MSYKLIFGPLEKLILGGIIALKVAIYRRLGMRRIVYKRNRKKELLFQLLHYVLRKPLFLKDHACYVV